MNNDELNAEIDRLHKEGLSDPAIGRRVGLTKSAVWSRRKRRGTVPKKVLDYEHKMYEIRRLRFVEGLTVSEIGRRLGIKKQNVNLWFRKMPDYSPPPVYPTKAEFVEHTRTSKSEFIESLSPWLPEDGIIDQVVIDRVWADDGCPVRATESEAREVIRQLVPKGLTDGQISRRLGVNDERISRLRESMGIERAVRGSGLSALYAKAKVTSKGSKVKLGFVAGVAKGKKVA